MILLHAIVLIGVLLPALSAPDPNIPHALAKINEARARAMANRARIRANARNYHRPTRPSRSKRQQMIENFRAAPEQSYPAANYYQEVSEPELVHICSAEDDSDYYNEEPEQQIDYPRMNPETENWNQQAKENVAREAEDIHPNMDNQEPSNVHVNGQNENSFIKEALEDFKKLKLETMDEPKSFDLQRQNSKFNKGLGPDGSSLQGLAPKDPESLIQAMKARVKYQEQGNSEKSDGSRDADAHFFSRPHYHSQLHGLKGVVTPQTSNLNLNINQGVHSSGHNIVPHQTIPISSHLQHGVNLHGLNHHGLSQHGLNHHGSSQNFQQSINTGFGGVPNHNFNVGDIRKSAVELNEEKQDKLKDAEKVSSPLDLKEASLIDEDNVSGHFDSREANPTFKKLKEKIQPVYILPYPSYQSNYQYHGYSGPYREAENLEDQSASGDKVSTSSDPREANPTFKKLKKKLQPVYIQPYPSYQTNYGRYREVEDAKQDLTDESVSENVVNSREANPTFKKMKKKLQPVYILPYPTYNTNYQYYGGRGPYREAENDDTERDVEDGSISMLSVVKEANPTFKKLMKKVQPIYIQPYPTYNTNYQHYGRYREAEEDLGQGLKDGTVSDSREANPTLKELKKLQPIYIQPYPAYNTNYQYYGRNIGPYREAEDGITEDQSTSDNMVSVSGPRDADPTHEKLKQKNNPHYYQHYPNNQYYGMLYRDGEDQDFITDNIITSLFDEAREADPTFKKLKKKQQPIYYQSYPSYSSPHHGPYRQAEERHTDDSILQDQKSSSFLFNVPATRWKDQFKRSVDKQLNDMLGMQRQLVNNLNQFSGNDEDLKFIADLGNQTLSTIENAQRKITKRSIPLTRLMVDPKVKLDVPKTMENLGTAAKNAFEDDRAPMYHLKHLVGSSKNAFLSAMKIPPQNMIIPSDYEIVKSSEFPSRSREDPDDSVTQTFKRVGEAVRDSIRSGQDTVNHLNEVAHNARNMLHTVRHSAPRLMIRSSQIPVVEDTRRIRRPNQAVLITPRILDLAEETVARKSPDYRSNFIRFSHLLDAAGISKPESKGLELEKFIIDHRGIREARVNDQLSRLLGKFRNHYNDDVDTVHEAISTLEDAKISVGAQNLRDLLCKMRNELTHVGELSPDKHKTKKYRSAKKKEETKEMGKFIETLFDGRKEEPKEEDSQNEVVGSRMYLPPELLQPFMGRPTQTELRNFFRDNGDVEMENSLLESTHRDKTHEDTRSINHNNNSANLGYVLGAINPIMFERLYNHTVKVNNRVNPPDLLHKATDQRYEDDGKVGSEEPEQLERSSDYYNNGDEDQMAK